MEIRAGIDNGDGVIIFDDKEQPIARLTTIQARALSGNLTMLADVKNESFNCVRTPNYYTENAGEVSQV